jgi:predicted amidohydrolase
MNRARLAVWSAALLACAAGALFALMPRDLSQGGRIHVAAIQTTVAPGGLTANQAVVERLVREAAGRGAEFILLPEHFPGQLDNIPEISLEQLREGAQTIDGPLATRMLALCRELDVNVAFPLAERRADGHVYNSTVYAGPGGIDGVYRKMALVNMLPGRKRWPGQVAEWQESEIFTRGTGEGVITWGGVRVGALICADGGFPNLYAARMAAGVQMFCHAEANAGFHVGEHYPMPDRAAALYRRPVILANSWVDDPFFQASTQIADANGTVLAHTKREPNVVIDAVVEIPPVPAEP